VAWSPSGQLIATCSRDKSVWIWAASGDGPMAGPADREYECISVGNSHTQDVKGVRWHPHDEILFSYSYDNTIRIWREEEDDWYCVETLTGHDSTVWQLSFDPTSPSGSRFVTCSDDRTLRIWERNTAAASSSSSAPTPLPATAVAPVRKNWRTAAVVRGVHPRTVFSVDWSAEGRIATGCADNSIMVFEKSSSAAAAAAEEGKSRAQEPPADVYEMVAAQPDAHSGDVNTVAWHPKDDSLLASGGDDGIVRLWRFVPVRSEEEAKELSDRERKRIAYLFSVEAAALAKLNGTAVNVAAAAQDRAAAAAEAAAKQAKEEEEELHRNCDCKDHGGHQHTLGAARTESD